MARSKSGSQPASPVRRRSTRDTEADELPWSGDYELPTLPEYDGDDYEDDMLTGELPEAEIVPIPVEKLMDMLAEKRIDLQPPYQREVVWSKSQMASVIESYLKKVFVPPLLFCLKRMDENGEPVYNCMDGKQRLTSLNRFFSGLNACSHGWIHLLPLNLPCMMIQIIFLET
ncbi:hypothetical protein DL93DRAFT_2088771 [Clavulina sp. PMI_390]|nr:hypothetical protein DL93DRAFT_2088771 [Clavulina sp. PMI_390]